jgi:hypothetical protein
MEMWGWTFAVASIALGCGRMGFAPEATDGAGVSDEPADVFDAPRLVIDAPVLMLDAGECPPGYQVMGTSCYRFESANLLWLTAELACEADAVGAHLIVINDMAEASFVEQNTTGQQWLGSTDLKNEGVYVTVTGQPAVILQWSVTEPDGAGENCLTLDTSVELADDVCDTEHESVCEYDGVPAMPSTYQ